MTSQDRTSDQGGEADERTARRAFELYEERGGEHGRDIDDWLQAEAELMAQDERNGQIPTLDVGPNVPVDQAGLGERASEVFPEVTSESPATEQSNTGGRPVSNP